MQKKVRKFGSISSPPIRGASGQFVKRTTSHSFMSELRSPKTVSPSQRSNSKPVRTPHKPQSLFQKTGTGLDLVAAMQACPYPDFEFEFPREPMPVRDPEF